MQSDVVDAGGVRYRDWSARGRMALTKVKSFKYVNRDRLSESELYSCNYSNKSNLFCAIVYSIPCTA